MASILFNTFKRDVMSGLVHLTASGDTVYCMLINSTGVSGADPDDEFRSSYTANEVSTTNYTAGGTEITSKTTSADTTNDLGYFDGADVSWSSVTLTARGAVVYKSTGAATTDPVICMFDFGSDQTATAGTFTIQWSTGGLIRLS